MGISFVIEKTENKTAKLLNKILTEKKEEIIENYLNNRETFLYKIKNRIAKVIIAIVTNMMNKDTEIRGLCCSRRFRKGGRPDDPDRSLMQGAR